MGIPLESGIQVKMSRPVLIFILLTAFQVSLICQETDYGPGYETLIVKNPAFTGSGPDGIIKLSYFNFFPGHHYNFHSVFMSYDSYFSSLHGGAGFFISNDYIGGIVNDLRGAVSYSYSLQAGRDLYFNAGLSAGLYHRGFNFNGAVFPDQIDAGGGISLPTSEIPGNENKTVFDIGTGFMFIYRNISGGFGITHLTRPDIGEGISDEEKINRKYYLHFLADILLGKKADLKLRPVASFELQGDFFSFSTGAVLETRSISFNSLFIYNNNRYADLQAGFSLMLEKLAVFYNYRFNIVSGNTMMPFSVIHQTGLNFSLNNVEKRNKTGTINLPVM